MPRKTPAPRLAAQPASRASMRPRPDAAENSGQGAGDRVDRVASMRPRPDAAENVKVLARVGRLLVMASMRPRPDAAENGDLDGLHLEHGGGASMRPRPDAAENMNDSFEIEATAIELQ